VTAAAARDHAEGIGALVAKTEIAAPSAAPVEPEATDRSSPLANATPAASADAGGAANAPKDSLGALIEQQVQTRSDDAVVETDRPTAARPPPVPQIDIWERIRRGFAIPDLETKLATNRTQWYAGQPDYLDRMSQRASLYLFHIVEEIEKRGMPTELALLPFVESAMQPEAVSSAKAAGLWQFIPSTGKIYALEQNPWHDQRRDIVESTRAALDYLQKLYADFGDWHLALAAYNWGEGAVGRAIARNRSQRKSTTYTALRMPRETQYYVPKLQAIKNIVREPAKFGIQLPAIRNEPYFVAVTKTRDIDVDTAARLSGMPVEEFRALNPGFNRPVIVGAAQPNILLPADRAETFLANLAAFESTGQSLTSWTTYKLAHSETLAQVAKRVDVSEAKLREANRIPPRYRLTPGSTILVPRDDSTDDDIDVRHLDAAFALVPDAPNLRQITYRVRRGETLNSVARRWRVQPEEITAWNNLRSPSLFAGQRLTLTVARGPARPQAKGAPRAATRPAQGAATSAKGRASSAVRPAVPVSRSSPAAAIKPTAIKPSAAGGTPPKSTQRRAPTAGQPTARAAVRP